MVSSTAVLQLLVLTSVAVAAAAAADEPKTPEPAAVTESGRSESPSTQAEGESKDVSILKQINRVNDDGSYTFGYEASDGSFKVETRDVAGNVKGMFGFMDEAGRLKRVSYSASNSSGFQASAGSTSLPAVGSAGPTPSSVPLRKPQKDEGNSETDGEPIGGSKSTAPGGVKKVLVSKRPVTARDVTDGRHSGYDLRRQLPRNDGNDAPDVYGVHDRSAMNSGPLSPVVSALMSELDPIGPYGPATRASHDGPDTISSRQAMEDEEPASTPPRYRQPAVAYQQQPVAAYRPPLAAYQPSYPMQLPPVAYQQQPVVATAAYPAAYGPPVLMALRDELMELILSFVQARVSQLASVPSYRHQPPLQAYPMPYQQPNYYVPSYYQGPRVSVPAAQQFAGPQQDSYAAVAQQQSSPRITQTLKDGLIRMLLATSPRYDQERIAGERAPRLTYRRTVQPSPVRSVQIIGDDDPDDKPVTTETPD